MPTSQMFFATVKSAGGPPAFSQLFTAANTSSVTIVGPGLYNAWLCGGGGGNADGVGGPGGFFQFAINFPDPTTTLEVGVGAFIANQSSSYSMKGGMGFQSNNGQQYGSPHKGGGGGGTYLKVTSGGSSLQTHNGYVAVVGGGGGSAVHGYSANIGGIGYGGGGHAWSSDWQNSGNAGADGYSNSGAGGGPESGGHSGGSASNNNQYSGANARGTNYMGGAGGGGYGGGAAGAAGHSSTGGNGASGGYISGPTVGSDVRIRCGGGGGGGSHGNACGGNGGGGGALLLITHTPNYSSSDLLSNNSGSNKKASDWPCYSNLPSNIQSQIQNKGGAQENGFVYISNV